MMKKALFFCAVLALVVGTVSVAALAAEGCASCHTGKYSLANEVKNISGHPPVPADADFDTCMKCHKAGKLAFGPILHKVHYAGGEENHFVSHYEGKCQHCHVVDPATGSISVAK
ncbi:MAG: hypothetical protein H0Z38_02220 [Firmicutes bacterium]|nr:hypothetical protein [Bacillota bacterium]